MALTEATVTFDLHQLLGDDFDTRRTRAYVKTNVESGTLMDTDTGETRLGDQRVTIASDGTGSFTTWAPGADGNPTSWQTSLVVEYARLGQRNRATRTFGPYTITTDVDLTELEEEQAVPAEYLTTVTTALDGYVTDAEGFADAASASAGAAAASAAEAVAIVIADADAAMAAAIEDDASDTYAALSASIADGVEPRAFTAEFWCDFTTKTIGSRPTDDDAGHELQYDKNSNPLSAFDIIEANNFAGTATPIRGLSSAATTDAAASYVAFKEISNDGTRRRFSGEFVLRTPGGNGGVCIGWWTERPGDNGVFPVVVPNAPCHLELYADRWVLSKFTGGSSGVTATATPLIATTLWGTPLAYLTRHRVDILVEDGRLTVDLPDGSQQVVTDSSILAANAVYPFLEIQASDQDTQGKPTWLWADGDSTIDRRNFFVRQLLGIGRKIVALDPSNTQSGTGRILSGLRNTASGAGAVIPGGNDNAAATPYSRAGGSWAKARAQGHDVFAGGRFSVAGDANAGNHHMRVTTTNATPTTLSVTGTTGTAGLIPTPAQAIACTALVTAYRSSNGESAMYRVDFAVKRTTPASTAIVGTPVVTVLYEDDATWDVVPYANTALDLWGLQVTGAASKTLHWNARITAVEVI